MMTLEQFNHLLRSESYRTCDENRRPRPLRGFRAGLHFFLGVFRAAYKGGHTRSEDFTRSVFSQLSLDLFATIESSGATIEVLNTPSLKALDGKPFVVAANHMSLVETMLLPGVVGAFSRVSVIAKSSLAKYPVFGSCLRATRPILLDRKNARKDLHETLTKGKALLQEGTSIIIFPQGSRSLSFNPHKFNSLAAKLAREANVPLVPIACKTDYALPGKWLKDFGPIDPSRPIKLSVGPILQPTLSQTEIQEQSISFIQNQLTQWGCEVINPILPSSQN